LTRNLKNKKSSSAHIPPLIEFDTNSFRNGPKPELTHAGLYGGGLEIKPPGQEQNMFPDHNPDPAHQNPKAPSEVPDNYRQNPFPLVDGNQDVNSGFIQFPGANTDKQVNAGWW
jgi:hypothetical protein